MDPLSALKLTGLPDVGNLLAHSAQETAAPPRISIADLQKLTPNSDVPAAATSPSGSASFSNVLGNFVQEVSDKQTAANESVAGLLGGKNVSLHQTMISLEEASVSFQLMVEVRNRLLDSYQELMRLQV